MTSAAELFYTRRSRVGRDTADSTPDPPSAHRNPTNPHGFHHRHHQYRHSRHEDDGELPRRGSSSHPRHLCHRVSQSDREFLRLENQVGAHIGIGNSNSIFAEASGSRNSLQRVTSRNDRLPSTVLMARARLLERLRGVSFTGNGGSGIVSGIPWDAFAFSDEFRLPDDESGDGESDNRIEWSDTRGPFDDPSFAGDRSLYLLGSSKQKPPGLSLEAISSLPHQTFHAKEDNNPSEECCICLERYEDGEKMFFLVCGHRFHTLCLDPWVRICGDCPYCRRAIVADWKVTDLLSHQ